ncbi:MAG: hypothetical protein M0Z69_14830 [Actinomycetota bacterium]|nr:hypothetical protein [Actinomycetota bacterium]
MPEQAMVDLPEPEDPTRHTASEHTASGGLTASEQPFGTSFAPKDSGRHQRGAAHRFDAGARFG